MLNLEQLRHAPVAHDPFPYMTASGLLSPGDLMRIGKDFPAITQPGIFSLSDLNCKGAFADLVEEIRSSALESIIEQQFGVDLSDKPLMITVRGCCQKKDGRIHTDSKDKIITCLLYLNDPVWPAYGGRLRLLRDGKDINSTIAEVSPEGGNLIAFKRTDCSWHGHEPFEGQRRYIMFNWVQSDAVLAKNLGRHKLSAIFKRMGFSDGY